MNGFFSRLVQLLVGCRWMYLTWFCLFYLLKGTIPIEMTRLVESKWFNLARNRLTGTIHGDFGNLVNVKQFYLSGNRKIQYFFMALSWKLRDSQSVCDHCGHSLILPTMYRPHRNHSYRARKNEWHEEHWLGAQPIVRYVRLVFGFRSFRLPLPLPCFSDFFYSSFLLGCPIPTIISGTIPTELANMKRIDRIVLDENNLTGVAPGVVCARRNDNPLFFALIVDCDEVQCGCHCCLCGCLSNISLP